MFKYFQTYLFVFHIEHPFDVVNSLLHESWRSVVQRYAIRECVLINEMRLATQFWRLTAFQRYPITRVFYSLLVLSHPQITTFLKIFTKLSHLNTSFFYFIPVFYIILRSEIIQAIHHRAFFSNYDYIIIILRIN